MPTIRARIDGIVGAAYVSEGALVVQNDSTSLATIQQLDPIYADFTQSVNEMHQLRRALDTGEGQTAVQKVNDTWVYRRSVPLSNTLHPNCVLCHTTFTAEFFDQTDNPNQMVGALVLTVPIRTSSSH